MTTAGLLAKLRLDPDQTRFALKMCTAMTITLAVAFAMEWAAVLGAITVLMLQMGTLGGVQERGGQRMVGAVTAILAGFFLLSMLDQDYHRLVLAVALWVAFCVFMMQASRVWYHWIIAMAYGILVVYGTIEYPENAFSWAVQVGSTVLVGATSVWLVNVVLWPNLAGAAFERHHEAALRDLRRLVEIDGRLVLEDGADPAERTRMLGGLFLSLPKLRDLLETTAWESPTERRERENRARALERFYEVASLVVDRGEALSECLGSAGARTLLRGSGAFRRAESEIGRRLEALAANQLEDGLGEEQQPVDVSTASDAMDQALIGAVDDTTGRLVASLERLRLARGRIEDGTAADDEPAPFAAPKKPLEVRLRNALITGAITWITAIIWRYLDWPGDFKIVIFATVMGALSSLAPVLPPRPILTGTGLGLVVAMVPYFLIFPAIEGHFVLFVITLFVFLFPFAYLKASPRPTTWLLGFLAAWTILEVLDPANSQTVSFSSFTATMFGVGGFGIGIAILWLVSPHVPEHELRAQVEGFFARCEHTVRGLPDSPVGGAEGYARISEARHGMLALLSACGLWASLLSYEHVPENDHDKVSGLMRSLNALYVRIECLQRACVRYGANVIVAAEETGQRTAEVLGEALDRIRAAAERVEAVGPLPDVQAPIRSARKLIETEQAAGRAEAEITRVLVLTASYRAVALQIEACRDRFDAINWKTWDYDRF